MALRNTRSSGRTNAGSAGRRALSADSTPQVSGFGAELRWFGYGAFSIWMFLSLVSWSPNDAGWFQQGSQVEPSNWLGRFGAWTSDFMLFGFGFSAAWFVVLSASLAYASWFLARAVREQQQLGVGTAIEEGGRKALMSPVRWAGFVLLMIGSCTLEAQRISWGSSPISFQAGGALGSVVGSFGDWALGSIGLTLLCLVMIVAGLAMFFRFSWLDVTERVGRTAEALLFQARAKIAAREDRKLGESAAIERAETLEEKRRQREVEHSLEIKPVAAPQVSKKVVEAKQREKQRSLFSDVAATGGLPPLSLLDEVGEQIETVSAETLEFTSRLIENRLADFGVQVKVVSAQPGPVITRYEIEPALGVKGSQIVNLARDLARALSVVSVRVVETIPGKTFMGLELPNPRRQMVHLSEIIGSTAFQDHHGVLPMALGKDISGAPTVVDLGRMPHLLVAGTTGSGKSVGVNAMLLSLLYRSTPSEVRLIMIDPKMLEFSMYEGIPHLLTPVVTDMKLAANALHWCVGEMERRYRTMSKLNTRNLAGFNQKVEEAIKKGTPLKDPLANPEDPDAPTLVPLPQIVVVIDELADLMMVAGKKIEELIARLAQKARAAGIHLILATQRPSVDVITGLIKANIPSRISFQVSSKIDSRTILDQMGAEALLGQGDMLFLAAGSGMPTRVHGAFVADDEVMRVVNFVKQTGEAQYDDSILDGADTSGGGGTFTAGLSPEGVSGEADPLYDEAVAIVLKHRRASISLVQRHLRIGYNRAARLLESMEQAGVVSTMQSNGNRDILVPTSQ
ncbi:DNA translocase FtsK 4TM domain-containing protein [beta proteobacterium MWH-UniP1]